MQISCVCACERERDSERERDGELESVRRALPESDKTCMYNPAAVSPAASLSARQSKYTEQPVSDLLYPAVTLKSCNFASQPSLI